jgi:hypothetical protein
MKNDNIEANRLPSFQADEDDVFSQFTVDHQASNARVYDEAVMRKTSYYQKILSFTHTKGNRKQ